MSRKDKFRLKERKFEQAISKQRRRTSKPTKRDLKNVLTTSKASALPVSSLASTPTLFFSERSKRHQPSIGASEGARLNLWTLLMLLLLINRAEAKPSFTGGDKSLETEDAFSIISLYPEDICVSRKIIQDTYHPYTNDGYVQRKLSDIEGRYPITTTDYYLGCGLPKLYKGYRGKLEYLGHSEDISRTTIKSVLSTLDFSSSQQQGIVQALIFSGCFHPLKDEDETSRHVVNAARLHKVIPERWQHLEAQIDDETITEILNQEFPISKHQLFSGLIAITQLRMLKGIDFAKGEHNRSETLDYKLASAWHSTLIEQLNLYQASNWEEKFGKIHDVVLHGMTEKGVKARIRHLLSNLKDNVSDEGITLYYLTNPRGLFNFESSTVTVLTRWFARALKLVGESDIERLRKSIQSKLDNSKHSWLSNLSLLKSEIIAGIEKDLTRSDLEWPIEPEGHFETCYDEVAELEGREPLNHSWPTAEHMVVQLLEELAPIYDRTLLDKIKLVPVNVIGKVDSDGKYRVANTLSTLEAFKERHGASCKETVAVITDNSVSHGAIRQSYLTAQVFGRDIKHVSLFDAMRPESVNIKTLLEQLAKTLYAMQEAKPFVTAPSPKLSSTGASFFREGGAGGGSVSMDANPDTKTP